MDSIFPVRVEIVLFVPVLDPVVSHVPGFGSSWFHVIFNNSQSCSTVSLQGSDVCRLWVPHGDECVALWDDLLSVDEEASAFCFSGRRVNVLDCLTHGSMDRSIGNCFQGTVWWWMVAQKIVSSHSASGLWENKVCSVCINVQDHVAGLILDCSVRIHGCIVHEPVAFLQGLGSWLGLLL